MNERRWIRSGESIIKRHAELSPNLHALSELFKGLKPSRNVRAEYFYYDLSDDLKEEFAKFSSRDQIELLLVSVKMQPQFQRPGFGLKQLCHYAEHIATRRERRQREAEAASEKARAEALSEMRITIADRSNLAVEDIGFVNVGSARFTHEVSRKERSILDMLTYSTISHLEGSRELGESAEDKLAAPVAIPIQPRLLQSDKKQTEKLLARIRDAQFRGLINRDVMHRCWFFYVLRFIRMQKAVGISYTTESILRGGIWVQLTDGNVISFNRRMEVAQLDEREREMEMDLIMRALLGGRDY